MDEIQEFTLEGFEAALQQQEKVVVVHFWATWSVPCLMYKPRLNFTAENLIEEAMFGSLNVDDFPELAERFSIITIPTTLLFYKNEIVKQFIGIQEPEIIFASVYEILGKKLPVEFPEIKD